MKRHSVSELKVRAENVTEVFWAQTRADDKRWLTETVLHWFTNKHLLQRFFSKGEEKDLKGVFLGKDHDCCPFHRSRHPSRSLYLRVLYAGSHWSDSIWIFSSSVSTFRLDKYCFTFLAIWASSYSFLAFRSELRRARFLCAPPCTSSMFEFVLPWLRDLQQKRAKR